MSFFDTEPPVAWLCRWTVDGTQHALVVWAPTIEDARQQAREHSAGPHTPVAARLATRQEAAA